MNEEILIGMAVIITVGILAQWVSYHLKFPSILLLMVFGIIAGPVTGYLNPDEFFGDLLFPIVSLSVALILFEGGMNLHIKELKSVGKIVRNLIVIGIPVTWVGSSAAAYYILSLPLPVAVLFGAILVVTGPTVVMPILRQVRPKGQLNSMIKWEGIVNDPIGALFAILVFEMALTAGVQEAVTVAIFGLLKTIFLGGLIGLASGYLLTLMMRYRIIPDFLQTAATLAMVLIAFAGANAIQKESGLFTVTIMGIIIANQNAVYINHIYEFKENLRIILISVLFIVLAARLDVSDLGYFNTATFIFLGVLIVVIRPASVFLSTIKSKIKLREKIFLSWMAPRGIVAAAVSSIFTLELVRSGYVAAEPLAPLTFLVIITTIVIYGLSAMPLAKWLKLANPNPQGCLILGAHPLGRAIGKELHDRGYKVLLVDTNYDNLTEARKFGLDTYYGSIISEYIIDQLNLDGIGRLLAMTPNKGVNSLASIHFNKIFGRNEVYQLCIDTKELHPRDTVSRELRGRVLFGENKTYNALNRAFQKRRELKVTGITKEFTYDDFLEEYGQDNVIPLFIITSEKKLTILTSRSRPEIKPGDSIIAIIDDEED